VSPVASPLFITSYPNPPENIIVKANFPAVPYRSLSDIIHNESHNNTTPEGIEYRLPFQNLRYRSRLRVVDFFPHDLEDFAVPYKKEYDYLSDLDSDDEDDLDIENEDSNSVKWEWRFCLLVEDGMATARHSHDEPGERMDLLVAKADAVFLLKMDAVK
jgi:protection-of-telomeres protein 1